MEQDFIPPKRLKLRFRYGMDGRNHEMSIPGWLLILLAVFLLILFISSLLYAINFPAQINRTKRIGVLEKENAQLKSSMEKRLSEIATTIDSLSSLIDSLQTGRATAKEAREYPSLGNLDDERSYVDTVNDRLDLLQNRLSNLILSVRGEGESSHAMPVSKIGAPSIYPCFGRISDGWGMRLHPFTNQMEFHYGIDFSNRMGTAVYATAPGVVTAVSYDEGYGKLIKIDHQNGYETLYAHLYSAQIAVGDRVDKGQIIGLMGNSGISTGPHLHYEIFAGGARVNPADYLNFIDTSIYADSES